jgi:hypothetical protein
VTSFSFWFIFYHLCTDHYCALLVIFFSPLNVCFLLSIANVHSLIACTNHSDSSVGYYIWSQFLISSTHHNLCTSITSQFVAEDNFFILGLLCYCWLSFCSHVYFLHRVFILFLLTICFFFSLGCVYVCSYLPHIFVGWVPILEFYL